MEPERDIEKQLRAFAKKRRTDAGAAFKLHPAARRRLQAEVLKRFADEPATEADTVSLWQFIRRQWAPVLGFALIIFLVTTMFSPVLSKAKLKSVQATATSNLRQIGLATQIAAEENQGRLPATLDELTNGLLSAQTMADPVSGQPFVYVGGGRQRDELPTNAVLAYSPEHKKSRSLLLADGTVQRVNAREFDEAVRLGQVPSTAPVATAYGLAGSVVEAKADRFQAASNSLTLLANFEVRQRGSVIELVDADGSVYRGQWLAANAPAQPPAPVAMPSAATAKAAARDKSETAGEVAGSQFFRVTGQNQTTRQNVEFVGQWSPSRITGTVTVDETNRVELRAAPVPR